MHIIVGLGNPGNEYMHTRHNVGFQCLDRIVTLHNLALIGKKFFAEYYKGTINSKPVIAIKPLTFMNESGKAVGKFASYFKVPAENISVIYDDLDMKTAKVRLRRTGSDGGHNGIKSINQFISNKYLRIKIGIDHPGHRDMVAKYVLRPFHDKERDDIDFAIEEIARNIHLILEDDTEQFASKINNK